MLEQLQEEWSNVQTQHRSNITIEPKQLTPDVVLLSPAVLCSDSTSPQRPTGSTFHRVSSYDEQTFPNRLAPY